MNKSRVYLWIPDQARGLHGQLTASIEPLSHLTDNSAESRGLSGRFVCVRNGGALYKPDLTEGEARVVPIGNAEPDSNGDYLFEPGRGGGRIDKLAPVATAELPSGILESGIPYSRTEFRWRYIQASHFGEVNTYFHVDYMAAYVDTLLRELGAQPLPRVTAVVNAHHAVTETNGVRDGINREGRWLPFQGGHYRLPSAQYDMCEPAAISPDGEIHLGPGRNLLEFGALVQAAGGSYRANASHNAGIIYHEYGHHITRHTADFRANLLCAAERQDNRKPAIDEGTCDYWAAAMLGTPHIWILHLRHDSEVIHPRSLSSSKTMADYDSSAKSDPHTNGTIWAAALWDLRMQMGESAPGGVRSADLMVIQALLLLGNLVEQTRESTLQRTRRLRKSYGAGLAALLHADELLNSGRNREPILSSFSKRGIQPADIPQWKATVAY